MAKTSEKDAPEKDPKPKGGKSKERKALVGQVKKVIKKSRRKLGDEKFEKELLRTISFLEGLQVKLAQSQAAAREKAQPPADPKPAKKAAPARKARKARKARNAK